MAGALSAGAVSLRVVTDASGVGAAIRSSVSSQLAGVGKFIGGTVLAGAGAVAAAGGVAVGMAISGGLNRALNIQDAQQKLIGLGHSASDVSSIMDSALQSVKGTAFGLGDAATVAASATAAGVQQGQALTTYLKTVADAAALSGRSLSDMGSIFNQVQSSGKAYNGTLQQLADSGIPIYQFLAKQLNTTTDGVFNLASQGKISSEMFAQAVRDNIGGSALASGATARGAFDNVRAALSRIGAAFLQPAVTGAPALFNATSSAIDAVNTSLKPVQVAIGAQLTSAITHVTTLITAFPSVMASATAQVKAGIADFTDGFKKGTDAIGSNQSLLAAWGATGYRAFDLTRGALKDFWNAASPVIEKAAAGFSSVFAAIGPEIIAVLPSIGQLIVSLSPLQLILTAIIPYLPDLTRSLTELALVGIQALVGGLGVVLPVLKTLASTVAAEILPAVVAFSSWLTQNIGVIAAVGTVVLGAVVGFQIYAAAIEVIRIATIAWAAVQTVMNIVLTANPIGVVVMAIAALVAGIIWVATQTTFFQDAWAALTSFLGTAWDAVVTGVTAAATWLWDTILKPVFDAIGAAVTVVAGVFTWWWQNVTRPVFDAIGAAVGFLWNTFLNPYFQLITVGLQIMGAAFTWWWQNFVSPVFTWVGDIIRLAGIGFQILWAQYVQPVINAIAGLFDWWWNSVVNPVFTAISDKVRLLGLGIQILWTVFVQPAINAISTAFSVGLSAIGSYIDDSRARLEGFGKWIGDVFNTAASLVRGAWSGIFSFVKDTFNNIIRAVNGVLGSINQVTGALSSATGVQINRLGTLPLLAEGATVLPRPGGTPVILGEAGRAETVVDTGKFNRLLDQVNGRGGGGDTFNVYETFDARATAAQISRIQSMARA